MTLRRLFVLIKALPYESPFWAEMRAAQERALKPTVEKIRERQAYWANRLAS